jgi:hypothetical protein
MREMNSARQSRRPVPRTTDSRHDQPIEPNCLQRNFAAHKPDQGRQASPGGDQGHGHARSRRLVDGRSLTTELCIDALVMALQRHPRLPGLVHQR